MRAVHPFFPRAEFEHRLARLRARLADLEVDAALFDEIEAMNWIAGYGNSENRWRCVVIPRLAEPLFLIRALDAGPCRARSWIADVVGYRDWEDPEPILASALAERGLARGRIGLDFTSYGMSLARFARLQQALPHALLRDVGPLIWELRLHKSDAEIALLRRAASIADQTLLRLVPACRAGRSQRDLGQMAVASLLELGADAGAPGPIAAARGWDFLHGHLAPAPLADGDTVHVELVANVGGYSARIMRCISVGRGDTHRQHVLQALAALQDRQIAAMRPGAHAAEVEAIVRQGARDAGLRQSFDNISGYTLGLYAAAGPRTSDFTRCFHPAAAWRLEPRMVFHMYVSADGASLSETVLITEAGPERLTQLPRALLGPG